MIGKGSFFAVLICYYVITKKILDTYFLEEITGSFKTFILLVLPLILKHGYKIIKEKFFDIRGFKLSPHGKELYKLTEKHDLKEFKEFVAKNFNGNLKSLEKVYYYTGSNLLIYAAEIANINLVKYLLENGFNVDCKDAKNGETCLIRAIHFNRLEIVELLLSYNPNLNLTSKEMKITPINIAVMRNKHKIVDLLLFNGAIFNLNNYLKSYANEYLNWQKVSDEVKKTIAKHKCKVIFINLFNIT
jgi:hypothetical protein